MLSRTIGTDIDALTALAMSQYYLCVDRLQYGLSHVLVAIKLVARQLLLKETARFIAALNHARKAILFILEDAAFYVRFLVAIDLCGIPSYR